jgi:hypothetical protein
MTLVLYATRHNSSPSTKVASSIDGVTAASIVNAVCIQTIGIPSNGVPNGDRIAIDKSLCTKAGNTTFQATFTKTTVDGHKLDYTLLGGYADASHLVVAFYVKGENGAEPLLYTTTDIVSATFPCELSLTSRKNLLNTCIVRHLTAKSQVIGIDVINMDNTGKSSVQLNTIYDSGLQISIPVSR